MKHLEKKLDRNYTRMLHTVWNKFWKTASYKTTAVGPLPISLSIQVWHSGHCWRSKKELINDILQSTSTHKTHLCHPMSKKHTFISYVHILDLPRLMADRDGWWERVKGIHAVCIPWWWWYFTESDLFAFPHSIEFRCFRGYW